MINNDIIEVVTNELNSKDVSNDKGWNEAPIITNNNPDRIAINAARAAAFAARNKEIIVK